MCSDIGVPLLISLVFLDIMKVVATNNDGSLHLGTMASTLKNTASDRDSASEWAFLVNVCPFDRLSRSLESQANVLPEPVASLSWPLSLSRFLRGKENLWLLQKCLLGLFRHC